MPGAGFVYEILLEMLPARKHLNRFWWAQATRCLERGAGPIFLIRHIFKLRHDPMGFAQYHTIAQQTEDFHGELPNGIRMPPAGTTLFLLHGD